MTEFRTRVAGWEEPCHPGSKAHDHASPTLPHSLPLCNPTVISRPTRVPFWPRGWEDSDAAWGSGVSGDAGWRAGRCTDSCSALNWARACKNGAFPSEGCARVPAGPEPSPVGRSGARDPPNNLIIDCSSAEYSMTKSGHGGQLEHQPRAAFGRHGGQAATVVAGDRRRDRQPAPVLTAAAPRPARELSHRRR
jgi:hypothetical protein